MAVSDKYYMNDVAIKNGFNEFGNLSVQEKKIDDTRKVYRYTFSYSSKRLGHEIASGGVFKQRVVISDLMDSNIIPAFEYKNDNGRVVVKIDANGEKVRRKEHGQELWNVCGWDTYVDDDGIEKEGIKCVEQELVPKLSKTGDIVDYVWQNVKDENGNDKVYKFSDVAKAWLYDHRPPDPPTPPTPMPMPLGIKREKEGLEIFEDAKISEDEEFAL